MVKFNYFFRMVIHYLSHFLSYILIMIVCAFYGKFWNTHIESNRYLASNQTIDATCKIYFDTPARVCRHSHQIKSAIPTSLADEDCGRSENKPKHA